MKFLLTLFATLLYLFSGPVQAQNKSNFILRNNTENRAFPLVQNETASPLITDTADADVVTIAAQALSGDINDITGARPNIAHELGNQTSQAVIIGTLGKSSLIDQLIDQGKFNADSIRGQWETFKIGVVDHPFEGLNQALVIAGSDRRGTAYGAFELSRRIGVSPWTWWADVHPKPAKTLFVSHESIIVGPPSVKYRGVFLNDEDWGLQPWAAKNMDTDLQDIGPKTYAHIFELLLRLKANFIWPAMHPSTKAFWYYKQNPKMADKYAIVVGSSHAEPMLRNNVFEWRENFKNEYGKEHGEWRYDTNKKQIYRYWKDRVKEAAPYECIYTIGMRGVHDSGMPGPKSKQKKIELLEQVIKDQRGMLAKYHDKPVDQVPQIFCPYKEVLDLYRGGLQLPDDATIVWADDNFGYIRQLSNPREQQRSGKSGVYYHFSYWGTPHDYLWLSTISPALVSYEMTKAYKYGARRLWIFNVGDIKPAEMDISFAMDLAWDVDQWTPADAQSYTQHWAEETFGRKYASTIAETKNTYYQLAQAGKPEHLGRIAFDSTEAAQRLTTYQHIQEEAEALYPKIPGRLKDAYFELVLYPVKGASLMNQKILYARKSIRLAHAGNPKALTYARKAREAFAEIKTITETYDKQIAGGKWDGIMSWHPRDLDVFFMPPVATQAMLDRAQKSQHSFSSDHGQLVGDPISQPHTTISASDFIHKQASAKGSIKVIPGLGIDGEGVTVMPFTAPSVSSDAVRKAPYVEYQTSLTPGSHTLYVKCLPTHHITANRGLRYAISVNSNKPQVVNMQTKSKTRTWDANVLRGYSLGKTEIDIPKNAPKHTAIRVYLLDPGLVLDQIEVL